MTFHGAFRGLRAFAFLLPLLALPAAGQAKHKASGWQPGTLFIDKGRCPGECCTYREWTALEAFELVTAPGSKKVVGRVASQERVVALTGEVHVTGARATVVREYELESRPVGKKAKRRVKPGDVVWVLTTVGEGYAVLWIDGLFYQEEAWFIDPSNCSGANDRPECFAKLDDPAKPPRSTWWVRLRTAKGLTGWAKHEGQLTDSDACQ